MGVVHAPDSEYAKEMRSWEANYTEFGPPGRPFVQRDYPAMLYKAGRVQGTPQIVERQTAQNEDERRNLESRGFVWGGPKAAMEALEQQEVWHAKLAAERNYEVQRMSEGARAEVAAVEAAAGMRHLPTIPKKPVTKRQPKADT